ncbi:hypothetical protein C5C13_13610 [Clavibacter michiganensis]|nr:hypothetical protein C5C13_13610 [Clavibacter michiganensis]
MPDLLLGWLMQDLPIAGGLLFTVTRLWPRVVETIAVFSKSDKPTERLVALQKARAKSARRRR